MAQASSPIIIPALCPSKAAVWQHNLSVLDSLHITQAALFLDETKGDRRAVYGALEETKLQEIPYVELPADIQEREIQYLLAKYKTKFFAITGEQAALPIIAPATALGAVFLIVNPHTKGEAKFFTETALAHAGVSGISLNTAALARSIIQGGKMYQAVIDGLDRHTIACTVIPPWTESWYSNFFAPKSHRLTSLTQLRYLTHVPRSYFGSFIVLKLDNLLEEQVEVQQYLTAFFAKHV